MLLIAFKGYATKMKYIVVELDIRKSLKAVEMGK